MDYITHNPKRQRGAEPAGACKPQLGAPSRRLPWWWLGSRPWNLVFFVLYTTVALGAFPRPQFTGGKQLWVWEDPQSSFFAIRVRVCVQEPLNDFYSEVVWN